MSTTAGMAFPIVDGVLAVARAYALVGVVVAVSFLLFGLDRIDPAARGSYVFRALIFPGLVLIWPAVVLRWRQALAPTPRRAQAPVARHTAVHAFAWICMAAVVPLLLGWAIMQGRVALPDRTNVLLSTATPP